MVSSEGVTARRCRSVREETGGGTSILDDTITCSAPLNAHADNRRETAAGSETEPARARILVVMGMKVDP
jgi:hypothetical protein